MAPVHADGRVDHRADPIVVARAKGAWLEDVDGRRYIDGNSSWWVAALGHGHPRLLRVLAEQSQALAHCALGGIAHEPAARLAEELSAIAPAGLSRVFYTDNGSTAIEVAVKMSVQAWRQLGAPEKTRFVALDGAFHGDTIGAAALGGVEIFRRPFAGVLFECAHAPFPESDAYARAFDAIARIVREGARSIAAVVVEPIVQGAAGMRMYPAEYLRELRALCDRHDVLLVLDEVFSGYGRTGTMWASEHAGIAPDLMCVGKAFASIVPMAATLTTERVFDAFRGGKERALYYGHTFCGYPLGAALAREVLAIYRDEDVLGQVARKAPTIATRVREDRLAPRRRARSFARDDRRGRPRGTRRLPRQRGVAGIRRGAGARRLPAAARRHGLRLPAAHHRRGRPRVAPGDRRRERPRGGSSGDVDQPVPRRRAAQ